jgi:hypothetical protein
MTSILAKIWGFLSQPLLPEEAQYWVYFITFIAFVMFPVWVLAYGKYVNRNKRREANDDNKV